jgi:hypothetical protein
MYETSCELLVFCLIAAHPEMGFPDWRYQHSAISKNRVDNGYELSAES